jgi:hypothetical protein
MMAFRAMPIEQQHVMEASSQRLVVVVTCVYKLY